MPSTIVVGGDAHKHTITLAALSDSGLEADVAAFEVTPAGMVDLAGWLGSLGPVERIGIEGSASWGLPVSTFLIKAGFDVREVNAARTSDRRRRRRKPKTDREDALAIAREVLADPNLPPVPAAAPLSEVHAELAVVCERRRSLVRRRQRLLNEAEAALAKLPLAVRELLPRTTVRTRLRALAGLTLDGIGLSTAELVGWLLESWSDLQDWEDRIDALEQRLPGLLQACGSTLTAETGIGVVGAAELVAEVGDARRFPTESAFARWAGVAPVATSSGEGMGEPKRHRLDLLGNRTVNRILYMMSITQSRHDPAGQAFLARKRTEGKTSKEARRAHKRQLANRIIRRMWADQRRLSVDPPCSRSTA